jgi:hypothetical protein
MPGTAARMAWKLASRINRAQAVPLLGGELVHRRDKLQPRVVDQDVHGAEGALRGLDEVRHLGGPADVGAVVEHLRPGVVGEAGAQPLDLAGVTQAVEHDAGAALSEGAGQAEADAAGRTSDEDGFFL